ncbi:MAG: threonyl-tRNA synthetase editing domain-containing protein [Acidilobaceae archaeon]
MLLIHAERFSYKPEAEALESPPDPPTSRSFENCLVVFVSVEEGDGVEEAKLAAMDAVNHARIIKADSIVIYPYAHLSSRLARPEEAYKVLLEIEKNVASLWDKVVARAPFGWYKSFELSCKGHPLAELSRSFIGAQEVRYKGVAFEEVVAKGLAEESYLKKNPWRKDVLETYSRLKFDSLWGRRARLELEERACKKLELKKVSKVEEPKWLYGLWGVASLASLCSKLEPGTLALWGDLSESLASTARDPLNFLSEISPELLSRLEEIKLGPEALSVSGLEGVAYAYKTRDGGLAPLVFDLGSIKCVGPFSSLLLSLIDLGLRIAESGKTPYLPFWLSPIQIALLPVSEKQLSYVERVVNELENIEVRVVVMKEGGLGSRIRDAGRSWIPIVAVVGDREVETETLSIRKRWEEGRQEVVPLSEFLSIVRDLKKKNIPQGEF